MTGLDESKEQIMEAAVIITDADLNLVAEGPNLIINVESSVLDNMGEWCQNQHAKVCRALNKIESGTITSYYILCLVFSDRFFFAYVIW